MRSFGRLLASALLGAGIWLTAAAPGLTQDKPAAPDNTRANKADRGPTADQQKENQSDRDLSRRIRKAITDDKSLSTYARNGVWTDELAFWDDVVRKAPDKAIGYHNRGNAHAKLGNVEAALRDMDKTISMFPREADAADRYEQSDFTAVNMAKTYVNRGSVYLMIGEVELAEADFTRSRALVSAPPIDVIGTLELADVYFKRKAYGHAIQEYGKVLQWDPENLEALNNRANAYSWTGKYLSAIMDLSRIIALRPDYALAYHNRGVARAWAGQPKKAADDFRKACDLGFPPACESIERAQRGEK